MKNQTPEDYKTYHKFELCDGSTNYVKCFNNGYGIQVVVYGKDSEYEYSWGKPPDESTKEGAIAIKVVTGNNIEPYHELHYINKKLEQYINISEADIPKYIEMIRERSNHEDYLDFAGNPIGLIQHKLSEAILIVSKFQRFRKTDDPIEIRPLIKELHKKADEVCEWIIMLEEYCESKD